MVRDKLLVVGDTHGQFSQLEKIINTTECFAAIVAGDFGYWRLSVIDPSLDSTKFVHQLKTFKVPVYFVDGNHEDHNSLEQLVNKYGKQSPIDVGGNCWYIPRGTTFEITNPITKSTKTILGLGGAFSIDWLSRVPQVSWFEQEQLRYSDIISVDTSKTVDFIVSHTCPECLLQQVADTCQITYNRIVERQSEKLLDAIYQQIKPKCWFFGHWHKRATYKDQQTTFELMNMAPQKGWYQLVEV